MRTRKIIFAFDIPLEKASFRVKVWRELKKMKATQQMKSYWSLPYTQDNMIDFRRISQEIIKNGGKAEISVGNVIRITK